MSEKKKATPLLDELERMAASEDGARLSKLYGKLVTGNPTLAGLKLRAAHYMVSSGHVDEAAEMLSSLSENGQPPAAHLLWGEIHAARQDSESAYSEYQKAYAKGVHPIAEFSCEVCETPSPHWQARCDNCGAWGMFESL